MADRRAEYRFRNGTVLDRLFFSITEPCIISGWTQSLGANGYRKFPGGLIVQWGVLETTAMALNSAAGLYSKDIALPVAFSNTNYKIIPGADYFGGFPKVAMHPISASQIRLLCDVQKSDIKVHWVAMGN